MLVIKFSVIGLRFQNEVSDIAMDILGNNGTFYVQEKEDGTLFFTEGFIVSLPFRQD
jgi:hypothetical protein